MTSVARLLVVCWCCCGAAGAPFAAGERRRWRDEENENAGENYGDTDFGTALYGPSDAAPGRRWTDRDVAELQCRALVARLVPTKTPDDAAALLDYFRLVGRKLGETFGAAAGRRRRASVAVADALGAYLHARALPRARMLYYEGRLNHSTTRRLHDLVKNIKYVLDTDGRGWARPVEVGEKGHDVGEKATATAVAALVIGGIGDGDSRDDMRCGGVDAGPYGLLRRRRESDEDSTADPLPFFDDDKRPHSLVVPWRPGQPVLYGVRDAACHRVLFDHCARSAVAAATALAPPEGHVTAADRYARELSTWLRDAVRPLVTPAAAARRWYPGLWAVRPVARLLQYEVGPEDGPQTTGPIAASPAPNVYLYATAALASATAVWTAAACVLFRGVWLR